MCCCWLIETVATRSMEMGKFATDKNFHDEFRNCHMLSWVGEIFQLLNSHLLWLIWKFSIFVAISCNFNFNNIFHDELERISQLITRDTISIHIINFSWAEAGNLVTLSNLLNSLAACRCNWRLWWIVLMNRNYHNGSATVCPLASQAHVTAVSSLSSQLMKDIKFSSLEFHWLISLIGDLSCNEKFGQFRATYSGDNHENISKIPSENESLKVSNVHEIFINPNRVSKKLSIFPYCANLGSMECDKRFQRATELKSFDSQFSHYPFVQVTTRR